jgi:hypothetical protein
MLRIEGALALLSLLIAFIYPSLGSQWFEKLEHRFSQLSRRQALSVVLIAATALALRAALLPIEPIPEPIVHDEFGYLLAADTFAHGRLTNPTHPMWVHFESFSILQKPTYQCFAQPAQGIILSLGKVAFGHPFWGVWLSVGLMCAAITWMLQGWLPPEWALLGGLLAILRYGIFGYWANSYWGGAAGAIGGALVLGALPRIKDSQHIRNAVLMGLGLAILASSRPYEGFILSAPIALALFIWLLGKNRPSLSISLGRVLLPLALVLTLIAAGLGFYLWRVTGSPFRMPYQIEQETYAVAPYMAWQHIRPQPIYNNPVIEKMYVKEALAGYEFFRSPLGQLAKSYLAWSFFLGPVLTLPFLLLVFALPRDFSLRKVGSTTSVLLIFMGIFIVGTALESFYNAHYSAPITGLILALVLLAMRQLRHWGPAGVFLTRAIPTICVLTFGLRAVAQPMHIPLSEFYEFAWYQSGPASFGRAAIQHQLEQMPGKQLVIVRYQTDHEPFAEWVYNDADIDKSKVVWARQIDHDRDAKLVDYFRDRHVWILDADENPPKLTELPSSASAIAEGK